MRRAAAAGDVERLGLTSEACWGRDVQVLRKARDCFPFSIGSDASNGLALWAALSWSELCPACTGAHAYYPDVGSPDECRCIGGRELRRSAGCFSYPYLGCGPKQYAAELAPVTVRRLESPDAPAWYLPQHARHRGWALQQADVAGYGLLAYEPLLAIDGEPVSDGAQVYALAARLPEFPPSRLSFAADVDDPTPKRELVYVDLATMRALAARMPKLGDWNETTQCRSSTRCYWLRVQLDGEQRSASYEPSSALGRTWMGLAAEIGRVADSWVAPVAPARESFACSELRTLPIMFELGAPDGTRRELRHIGAFTRTWPLRYP